MYKITRTVDIGNGLGLNLIQRLATSEKLAKAYQAEYYRKYGQLLQISKTFKAGLAIFEMKSSMILGIVENEKEARTAIRHFRVIFPLFEFNTLPLTDLRLAPFFLKEVNNG
ncbi:hypothetical protein [Gallibacterium anatis]|uniref:hypothetical protein n=1 Tax=Gallibacterium anatis TaxID=750 RepID=UPI0038B3604A